MRDRNLLAQRLTYEMLWEMNAGWDYLTEENAAASIDLLDRLLLTLAGCLSGLPPCRHRPD